jgi:Trk-type K+ transport system membrane component
MRLPHLPQWKSIYFRMRRMKHPVAALLVALLLLGAGGAALLCQPWCAPRDARETEYFLARAVAESAFDALSAACGCGLASGPLEKRYSPAGLWVLWSVGVLGAIAYLLCGSAVLRRLIERARAIRSDGAAASRSEERVVGLTVPILASGLGLWAVLSALVYFAGRAACPTVDFGEAVWLVGSAFFSLGLVAHAPDAGTGLMLAFVGLLGALGWMIWLLPLGSLRREFRDVRVGRVALVYVAALAALGGLVCALEQPRGGESIGKLSVAADEQAAPLSREALASRYLRSVVAVTNAATTGIGSEPLAERGLRDGSKAALAGAMLIGGILGGPGGGLTITLLVLACGRRGSMWRSIAARVCGSLAAMTIVVALALLVIEAQVASRYQPPPTFADALVDAGSAVGGGALSSGLTATVTARNLISGIGLGLSQYQIGMLLLMTAMIAGRSVPIALLAQFAKRPDAS